MVFASNSEPTGVIWQLILYACNEFSKYATYFEQIFIWHLVVVYVWAQEGDVNNLQ